MREADGKCHIRHVIGPDEYHEDVDDNAFTEHAILESGCRCAGLAALIEAPRHAITRLWAT